MRLSRFAALCAALPLACATTPPPAAQPGWLSLAGRHEPDPTPDCAQSRFGVGGVSGVKSKALLHRTAFDRARADLAVRLRACLAQRLDGRLPPASAIAPEEAKVSPEAMLQQLVGAALAEAEVVERWSPDAETEFVRVEAKTAP